MSTIIRPELSEKNPYWIEKHRYYELKHFCLQYPIWKRAHDSIEGLAKRPLDAIIFSNGTTSDPTARCSEARAFYAERMSMIENATKETDPILGNYIFQGIISGVSYDLLNSHIKIPCCKEDYYKLYRRFFWLLNKIRK